MVVVESMVVEGKTIVVVVVVVVVELAFEVVERRVVEDRVEVVILDEGEDGKVVGGEISSFCTSLSSSTQPEIEDRKIVQRKIVVRYLFILLAPPKLLGLKLKNYSL